MCHEIHVIDKDRVSKPVRATDVCIVERRFDNVTKAPKITLQLRTDHVRGVIQRKPVEPTAERGWRRERLRISRLSNANTLAQVKEIGPHDRQLERWMKIETTDKRCVDQIVAA